MIKNLCINKFSTILCEIKIDNRIYKVKFSYLDQYMYYEINNMYIIEISIYFKDMFKT